MRRRFVLLAALGPLAVACVDLFHSTDFDTLCVRAPADPRCGGADAAAADAGTDGTSDAKLPALDFCEWSPAEARAQALRSCAWLGACEGPLGETAFGPCAIHAQLAYDCAANPSLRPAGDALRLWTCLALATTCEEVDRCVFPNGNDSCGTIETGSFTGCGEANGAVRVRCAANAAGVRPTGVEPCVMLGKTCTREDESTSSCTGTTGVSCAVSECSGTSATVCADGGTIDTGVDCATMGAGVCRLATDGQPQCRPVSTAPVCLVNGFGNNDVGPRCNGAVVTSCLNRQETSIDCDRLRLPCDVSVPVPPHDPAQACIRRGASPDLCTEADSCDGTRLRSCARGALFEVDCASLGFRGCAVTGGYAACTR